MILTRLVSKCQGSQADATLYAPSEDLEALIFAAFQTNSRLLANPLSGWLSSAVARTDCFLKGPSLDRQGYLYVVELAHGFIFYFSSDGKEYEIATKFDRELNGLVFISD